MRIYSFDPKSYFSLKCNTVAGDEDLKDKVIINTGATMYTTNDLPYLTSIRGTDGLVEMVDGSIIGISKVEKVISTTVMDEIQKII